MTTQVTSAQEYFGLDGSGPWESARWVRAGIIGAFSSGRVLIINSDDPLIGLIPTAFGASVICQLYSTEAVAAGVHATQNLSLPCRFALGQAQQNPFPPNTFDTVVVCGIPKDTSRGSRVLQDALSVCRSQGRLVVSVPNSQNSTRTGEDDSYSRQELQQMLLNNGVTHPHWSPRVARIWHLAWFVNPEKRRKKSGIGNAELDSYASLPLPMMPEANELVSVLVPTFNRAPLLRRTLDSIHAQTYQNLEIIVIDDGSADNTAEVVARHPGRPGYIRKSNGGKSSALNAALPLAKGEYICIADDDDLFLPYKLAQQVHELRANPGSALVASASFAFQGSLRNILHYDRVPEFVPRQPMPTILRQGLGGTSPLYRTDALREIGSFDETLVRSQDLDIWIRLARKFPFCALQFPAFMVRSHRGLRGVGADRFSPEVSEAKWQLYDQKIFRKVYLNLGLAEVDPRIGDSSDCNVVAAGLVFRARIMTEKLLIDFARRDLEHGLELLGRAPASMNEQAQSDVLGDLLEIYRMADDCAGALESSAYALLKLLCRRYPRNTPTTLDFVAKRIKAASGISKLRHFWQCVSLLSLDLRLESNRRVMRHVVGRLLWALRVRIVPASICNGTKG